MATQGTSGGDAYHTLQRFWDIQNNGDYNQLVELFADDAVLVDPIYGTFTGPSAIAGFMEKMTTELEPRGISFRLVELAGDEQTAWAQWEMTGGDNVRSGVGIYRVSNGRLTYYRDYLNA